MKTQPIPNMTTVQIHSTQSDLDGLVGEVVGIASSEYDFYFYVVLFEKILPTGYNALVITQSCIKVI